MLQANGRTHYPDPATTLWRDSRRVRAGTAEPARRRDDPVSDAERAEALDNDALLLAARHRAEVKLARTRGMEEGYAKGVASAQATQFWSGTAFGILLGSAVVYFAVRLGWWL